MTQITWFFGKSAFPPESLVGEKIAENYAMCRQDPPDDCVASGLHSS